MVLPNRPVQMKNGDIRDFYFDIRDHILHVRGKNLFKNHTNAYYTIRYK